MPLIYLVRHGQITNDPVDQRDPELGAEGLAQAHALAQKLHERLRRPLPILTSPLRRCRETAAPLAHLWQLQPTLEPRVIEVPSTRVESLSREEWLKLVLTSNWSALEQGIGKGQKGRETTLADWRRGVCEAILACSVDTVIHSHFVPINVIVGAALGQDRVISFKPGNASVTVVATDAGTIRLIERGQEMESEVVPG